jgi:hypothetical protein
MSLDFVETGIQHNRHRAKVPLRWIWEVMAKLDMCPNWIGDIRKSVALSLPVVLRHDVFMAVDAIARRLRYVETRIM